ncbi:MAG: Rid family detoxifying hydrolase [Pseudohongiellaceae bacterium]
MTEKTPIETKNAPGAIGPYSQAIKTGNLVFISGQVGFDPVSMKLADGVENQTRQVFANLTAVAEAAGGTLQNAVKLTIYVNDLGNFKTVNEIMAEHFEQPYPARATIEVSKLPVDALVEIDAILAL